MQGSDALCQAQSHLVVYEAGPCGYGWARHLSRQGWRCEVISPAHITRKAAEKRLKTDRLDAQLLARESRAGNLVKVIMPDARNEAIRDLSRARDACGARLRARLQLKALLLRQGRAYHGKSSWTAAHERHLAAIRFDHPAQQFAFDEYRQAVKDAHERVECRSANTVGHLRHPRRSC
ncbi:MAG: transposase [Proteobacteria bacterium]|nr:transposase [Pseudomonadota bacterium]